MTDKQYPRYQWSYFVGGSRDQQIVFRTEKWDDFLSEVKKMKAALKVEEKPVQPALEALCPLHSVPLIRREGQYGEFWSHKYIDGNGKEFWCDGKKMKPAKAR